MGKFFSFVHGSSTTGAKTHDLHPWGTIWRTTGAEWPDLHTWFETWGHYRLTTCHTWHHCLFDASHLPTSMRHTWPVSCGQAGSCGGTHSASLRSALLPSPASSLPRELVSGRHLPLPEAVGWPRPPRQAACLASHRHCPIFPLKSLVSVKELDKDLWRIFEDRFLLEEGVCWTHSTDEKRNIDRKVRSGTTWNWTNGRKHWRLML